MGEETKVKVIVKKLYSSKLNDFFDFKNESI